MQVNKTLAAKVIMFEKQIRDETKRRQELERMMGSSQPNLVNLNQNNRVNNYPWVVLNFVSCKSSK